MLFQRLFFVEVVKMCIAFCRPILGYQDSIRLFQEDKLHAQINIHLLELVPYQLPLSHYDEQVYSILILLLYFCFLRFIFFYLLFF